MLGLCAAQDKNGNRKLKWSYYSCINYCYYGGTIAVYQLPSSCYHVSVSLQGVFVPLRSLSSADLWAADKHPFPGGLEMGRRPSGFQVDKHIFGENGGFPIPTVDSLDIISGSICHPAHGRVPGTLSWWSAMLYLFLIGPS